MAAARPEPAGPDFAGPAGGFAGPAWLPTRRAEPRPKTFLSSSENSSCAPVEGRTAIVFGMKGWGLLRDGRRPRGDVTENYHRNQGCYAEDLEAVHCRHHSQIES